MVGNPRRRSGGLARREGLTFYLFASPYILGLVFFTLGPILASLLLSLTSYDLLRPPRFVGLANYGQMFFDDPDFWKALKASSLYTAMHVPLIVSVPLLVALLLNQRVHGLAVFRTIFYVPSVMSGVAVSILWIWIFNARFGVLNWGLSLVGVRGPDWLGDESTALPSIVLMSMWSIGGSVVIYLAALQGTPQILYEAAEIDGANAWHRFRHVTVPQISPVILFTLVTGVIGSMQVFTQGFVMTSGGPNKTTLFYNLYLYLNAFRSLLMGYASAQAWFLFLIILACTALVFRLSRSRVYYEGERRP